MRFCQSGRSQRRICLRAHTLTTVAVLMGVWGPAHGIAGETALRATSSTGVSAIQHRLQIFELRKMVRGSDIFSPTAVAPARDPEFSKFTRKFRWAASEVAQHSSTAYRRVPNQDEARSASRSNSSTTAAMCFGRITLRMRYRNTTEPQVT